MKQYNKSTINRVQGLPVVRLSRRCSRTHENSVQSMVVQSIFMFLFTDIGGFNNQFSKLLLDSSHFQNISLCSRPQFQYISNTVNLRTGCETGLCACRWMYWSMLVAEIGLCSSGWRGAIRWESRAACCRISGKWLLMVVKKIEEEHIVYGWQCAVVENENRWNRRRRVWRRQRLQRRLRERREIYTKMSLGCGDCCRWWWLECFVGGVGSTMNGRMISGNRRGDRWIPVEDVAGWQRKVTRLKAVTGMQWNGLVMKG